MGYSVRSTRDDRLPVAAVLSENSNGVESFGNKMVKNGVSSAGPFASSAQVAFLEPTETQGEIGGDIFEDDREGFSGDSYEQCLETDAQ